MTELEPSRTVTPAATGALRIATRGSKLALEQSEIVAALLRAHHPTLTLETVIVRTTGDENQSAPVAALGDGAFVRAVEAALLEGRADIAVHSAKDLPSAEVPGLTLAAFPERADPRDVLVSRDGARFEDLPAGARVGTGSPRRAATVRALRPELEVAQIRGNVDTRLAKLRAGDYDAIVLAAAGLARLNRLDEVTQFLDPTVWIPAVGQGALAVQCRANDPAVAMLAPLDHANTRVAVEAERALLRRLGQGCRTPVGAHAVRRNGTLLLRATLLPENSRPYTVERNAPIADAEALGTAVAEMLLPHIGG